MLVVDTIYNDGATGIGAEYDLRIVDRIGGGDAFDAGFIYGMLARGDLQYAVDFAAAAAALKHTIEGDVNFATVDEVETLMRGGGSMRVQR